METLEQIECETGVRVSIGEDIASIHLPTNIFPPSNDIHNLLSRLRPFIEGKAIHFHGPAQSESKIILKK